MAAPSRSLRGAGCSSSRAWATAAAARRSIASTCSPRASTGWSAASRRPRSRRPAVHSKDAAARCARTRSTRATRAPGIRTTRRASSAARAIDVMTTAARPAGAGGAGAGSILDVTNARRWTIVGLLFTASLINYFDRATISFALPLISKELALGPEAKGLLLSAFFWSYALMQIPMGILSDRVNLRWLYAAAFTLWSISQGLIGLAGGLGTLIFFRVLLGIGESIYLPGGSKIVSLLFRPAERGLPCGVFDAGTRTGLVVEGVLVPWMLVHYGWRASFSLVGFAALLWLIPWLLTTPKNLHGRADHSATSLRPG